MKALQYIWLAGCASALLAGAGRADDTLDRIIAAQAANERLFSEGRIQGVWTNELIQYSPQLDDEGQPLFTKPFSLTKKIKYAAEYDFAFSGQTGKLSLFTTDLLPGGDPETNRHEIYYAPDGVHHVRLDKGIIDFSATRTPANLPFPLDILQRSQQPGGIWAMSLSESWSGMTNLTVDPESSGSVFRVRIAGPDFTITSDVNMEKGGLLERVAAEYPFFEANGMSSNLLAELTYQLKQQTNGVWAPVHMTQEHFDSRVVISGRLARYRRQRLVARVDSLTLGQVDPSKLVFDITQPQFTNMLIPNTDRTLPRIQGQP